MKDQEALVYRFLKDGFTQKHAAKALYKKIHGEPFTGENKQKIKYKRVKERVSYYARKLEKKMLIVAISDCGNPKIYQKGPVSPRELESPTPVGEGPNCRGQETTKIEGVDETAIDLHHNRYRFEVLAGPYTDIKWDNISKLKSGVIQHHKKVSIYKQQISVRYDICPKSGNWMEISLTKIEKLPKDKMSAYTIMEQHIYDVMARVQELFTVKLGLPRKTKHDQHFEVPIYDRKVSDFVKENSMHFRDEYNTHMDASPPSKVPKIEVNDFERARLYEDIPERLLINEEYTSDLNDKIKSMMNYLSKLTDVKLPQRIGTVETGVNTTLTAIDFILKLQAKIAENQKELYENQKRLSENMKAQSELNLQFSKSVTEMMSAKEKVKKEREKDNEEYGMYL